MQVFSLDDMYRGWFVGDFSPCVIRSKEVEVALQKYDAGSKEKAHFHAVATEVTLISKGRASFNGKVVEQGEIVLISPGETVEFIALTDTETVVIKLPSLIGDKYEISEDNPLG
jgi:quercetin dioxygenase-like cupin family protein